MLERPGWEAEVADLSGQDPSEVLAVIQALDLALRRFVDVDAVFVEEAEHHRLGVIRVEPHGHPGRAGRRGDLEPGHRHGGGLEVVDVHASRVAADHDGPLQDSGGSAGVARTGDGRTLLQGRGPGHREPDGKFGADIHIGQASDTVTSEQRAGSPRLPHDRGVDDGPGLDRLERVDLHPGTDLGVGAHEALVAEDYALFAADSLAQIRAAAEHTALDPYPGTEVGVVVYHGALDDGVVANADVTPQRAVRPQAGPGTDHAVVADDGRADHLDTGVDFGALAHPDAWTKRKPLDVDVDLAIQDVLMGAEVGLERADVFPVPVGHVAIQALAGGQSGRERIGREVHGLTLSDKIEDLGLEHVDPGVDGVAEHLAPCGLLQEPLDGAVLVGDDDPELQGVLDRLEGQGGQSAMAVVEVHDLSEIDVGEHVA